jgi:hypothetical protein
MRHRSGLPSSASGTERGSPPWWARRVSPLWWALPLAFVAAQLTLGLAVFAMCGVRGCGGDGGGFGPPILAVSGAVFALPLVLTHWHSRLSIRVAVGAVFAVMWAGLNAAWM